MLEITEHYQFYTDSSKHYELLLNVRDGKFYDAFQVTHKPILFAKSDQKKCLSISFNAESALIESSYYIGLGWIKPWGMPVLIEPKLNESNSKLNYVQLLLEALKEPENINHLDGLMEVNFNDEWIEVNGNKQVELTPFLIVQYLMSIRSIVRKGLKKDYYPITENLHSKVKGKILVGRQTRENLLKNKVTNTICSYQEFGTNSEVNQFLKYVLSFVRAQVENYPSLRSSLIDILNYDMSSFEQVSLKKFHSYQKKVTNSFYKEYNVAIQLGNQILRLMDNNLSISNSEFKKHPPHWIDMSKLFELYVFKKLREKFSGSKEVTYHLKTNYQELDFIVKKGDFKVIVDAKYKPRYKTGNPSISDARQLSGYSRLNSVYNELDIHGDQLIPVYIVYPKELINNTEETESNEDFEIETDANNISLFRDQSNYRKSKTYREMYLQEISLKSYQENI